MKKKCFMNRYLIAALFIIMISQAFTHAQVKNEKDTSIRNLQISFLPFMNINSSPKLARVNVSVNILAGYVQEVRMFQAGSVLNVVNSDARNCQLAGVGNIVLGSSRGLQAAGIFNVAKSVDGVQAAGVLNAVHTNVNSCQLAGIGNIVGGTTSGLQAAGIINVTKTIKGGQIAGILNTVITSAGTYQFAGVGNIVGDSARGLQAAGIVNATKTINGVQAAGVINVVMEDAQKCQLAGVGNFVGGSFHGLQSAGVFNYASRMEGTQISGLLNIARVFKGVQISVVNLADSCEGTPIGVFSFVGNGYHKIELSTDELLFSNIAFRTGVNHFHNIFTVGIRPDNFESPLWSFGYGVGTTFRKTDRLFFDFDLSTYQIIKGNNFDFNNELYKLYAGVDFKIAAKTSIAAGLSYNYLRTDTDSPQYSETLSKVAPYSFSNKTYGNGINLKSWLGAKIAIRFL
jgi:hypothetical protein